MQIHKVTNLQSTFLTDILVLSDRADARNAYSQKKIILYLQKHYIDLTIFSLQENVFLIMALKLVNLKKIVKKKSYNFPFLDLM